MFSRLIIITAVMRITHCITPHNRTGLSVIYQSRESPNFVHALYVTSSSLINRMYILLDKLCQFTIFYNYRKVHLLVLVSCILLFIYKFNLTHFSFSKSVNYFLEKDAVCVYEDLEIKIGETISVPGNCILATCLQETISALT